MSKKDIARTINVSTSTIHRELRHNSGVRGKYNWKTAQENARRKKCRAPGNHAKSQEVRDEAIRLLLHLLVEFTSAQCSAATG